MKLYVVYFRMMEDSPEVTIECVTTDEAMAKVKLAEAKAKADKFTKDHEEDCSWRDEEPWYWYEARMKSFDMTEERKPGDTIFVMVQTIWDECVETTVKPFLYRENADSTVDYEREQVKKDYPDIHPFEEDENFDESFYLTDESVMVDVYFSVEPVVLD